jgi:hypothetical protein
MANYSALATAITGRPPVEDDDDPNFQRVLFGGPTAKGANQAKLEEAQRMKTQGADRDAIWGKTGWWEDAGRWNFEFSPENGVRMQVPTNKQLTAGVNMPQVFDYPELYVQYPDAKKGKVFSGPSGGAAHASTLWSPDMNDGRMTKTPYKQKIDGINTTDAWNVPFPTITLSQDILRGKPGGIAPTGTVIHETQHAIDNQEGSQFRQPYNISKSGVWDNHRIELRANNAAFRDLQMSPEERQKHPPWATERPVMDLFMRKNDSADSFRGDMIRRSGNVDREFEDRKEQSRLASRPDYDKLSAEEAAARQSLTKSGYLTAQAKRDIADIGKRRFDLADTRMSPSVVPTPKSLLLKQWMSYSPYDDTTYQRYNERPMGPR